MVDFKRLGFNPGDKVVKVYHNEGRVSYYKVFSPHGYIKKCNKDGKEAHYLGILDKDYKIRRI